MTDWIDRTGTDVRPSASTGNTTGGLAESPLERALLDCSRVASAPGAATKSAASPLAAPWPHAQEVWVAREVLERGIQDVAGARQPARRLANSAGA